MGEVGIEGGDLTTLKTGSCSCPGRVLRMLSDLEDDPLVKVIDAPYPAFMLKAGSSSLCRGMDSPLVWRGKFLDNSPLDKGNDRLFEYRSCGEGPYRGSLSLERGRRGGTVVGFAGHEELGDRIDLRGCAS